MNQDFILGRLSEIMGWDNDRARQEFEWLRLMSRMKYDGYQDFLAGMRFIESLADWLQQFAPHEREAAYRLVRGSLIYVSTAEMNHLVELFYPETVQRRLQNAVAARLGIAPYRVWAAEESARLYRRLLRQTLFAELSDGARIDVFRRVNAGTISNEQVITAPRVNDEKWADLIKDLREDLKDAEARFSLVFLIDDFIGSGTTLLRKEDGRGSWRDSGMTYSDSSGLTSRRGGRSTSTTISARTWPSGWSTSAKRRRWPSMEKGGGSTTSDSRSGLSSPPSRRSRRHRTRSSSRSRRPTMISPLRRNTPRSEAAGRDSGSVVVHCP